MKRKSKWKGLVIALVVMAVVAGAGFGGWYFLQNRSTEPVKVIPFQYIGMTEYWGDNRESYGFVSTDRIQTVFLTGTQKVTQILVQAGDTVKKGDVLLTYDTTLSDLALDREKLAVEKLKLQLDEAKDELKDIKKMKPMVPPKPTPLPEIKPETGVALKGDYQISDHKDYDGSSQDKALVLWLRDGAELDDTIFQAVWETVKADQQPGVSVPADPPAVPPVEETTGPIEETAEPTEETTEPTEEITEPTEETTEPTEETTEPTEETTEPTEDTTEPTVPPTEEESYRFFLVVKVTEGDMSLTNTKVWQGMEVIREKGSYRFRLFDASFLPDYTVVRQEIVIPPAPQIDLGSGYTAKQIAQMRA